MKSLKLDLEPFKVNGVVHVGAGVGDFAEYYHKLGVHKVLWIEAVLDKYNLLYENKIGRAHV